MPDQVTWRERSVNSLQAIYAVIIALAIGQAIKVLLVDESGSELVSLSTFSGRLPSFLAFFFVLVPFFHGMNRHLDTCYVEREDARQPRGALLFEFLVFFVESALLFAAATLISPGLSTYALLGLLLAVDVVWAEISDWINYRGVSPGTRRWAVVNLATVLIGFGIFTLKTWDDADKSWLLCGLSLARSVVDYAACWSFYFPNPPTASGRKAANG